MTTPPAPRRFHAPLAAAAATALLAAALLASMLLSPANSSAGADSPEAPAEESVSVGFSRDMAVHHQQAVEMSFLVLRNGNSPGVRTLAYDIANTQANQRGMLLGWLTLWNRTPTSSTAPMQWMHMPPPAAEDRRAGVLMPGMAARSDLRKLEKTKGKRADELYLRLMIEHHRGGVHMAQGALRKDAALVVERLAKKMVTGQRAEIDLMRSLLKSL